VADVARFLARPPLRCCSAEPTSESLVCGAPAAWRRPTCNGSPAAYFCDAHQEPGDVPIAGDTLFRRVSVTCEISFAGVSANPGIARAEALARLELAVERAGGMLNLHTMTDALGRHEPPAPPPRSRAGRPRGH
jgi:hypothetical protein